MLWDSVLPDALQWEVGLQELYRKNGTPVPDKREIYRLDNNEYLSTVGLDYTPLQNHECAEFLQTMPDAVVEKAGVFNGGTRVWWALRLPGVLRIGGDTLHKYSIMVNAFDGILGFRWFVTPIRPSCSNMVNMLIKSAMDFSISARHTRNIVTRIAEASRVFERVNAVYNEIAAAYTDLANQDFEGVFQQYVASVLQPGDLQHGRYKTALEKIEHNRLRDDYGYSKWGALNAVTEYIDHQRPMRGTKQEERRFENAVFGTGAKLKQRAYDMLQEGPDGPNYISYFSNRTEGSTVEKHSEVTVN